MHQPTLWSHSLLLSPEPGSAARARDFVSTHLREHDLGALVDDVRLVTSELATNALEHARTPITLTLAREGHTVLLSVRDRSPQLPRPAHPDPTDVRGRGLVIVGTLSSGWGVEVTDEAKSVWARFDAGRTMAPAW